VHIISVGHDTVTVSLQLCHGQLTYACNMPNAVNGAPPEDKKVMLKTGRGPCFSIN
jgi:hypothetical protein